MLDFVLAAAEQAAELHTALGLISLLPHMYATKHIILWFLPLCDFSPQLFILASQPRKLRSGVPLPSDTGLVPLSPVSLTPLKSAMSPGCAFPFLLLGLASTLYQHWLGDICFLSLKCELLEEQHVFVSWYP